MGGGRGPARALGWVLSVLLAAGALAPAARGHPGHQSGAVLSVRADGGVSVRVSVDALAFALNDKSLSIPDEAMRELLEGPEAGLDAALKESHARFERTTHLEAESVRVALRVVEGPTLAGVRAARVGADGKPVLPILGEFVAEGRLPSGAKSLTLRLPEIAGDVVLTVERPGREAAVAPVPAGTTAGPIDLGPEGGESAPPGGDLAGAARSGGGGGGKWGGSAWATFGAFVVSGFEHIVPLGADHVLFVLGLFLGARTLRGLLLSVTAFTLAHSVTLALAALGVFATPGAVVEPLIALSIAAVAAENVLLRGPSRWRTLVVFGFGLVHGLGFASVLADVGLPPGKTAVALVGFNVGVELGQLAVVGGAAAVLWWWRGRAWYRPRVVVPLSVAIGVVGIAWCVQRVL